jgi:hypothetical protein
VQDFQAVKFEQPRREILFEGFNVEQILSLPNEQIEALVLTGEPNVFRIGSATILGEFRITENRLIIELAQIEQGGEGVLPALSSLARRFATIRKLTAIEWIVHAVHCGNPNLKLRRVLVKRGFVIQDVPGSGEAYHFIDRLDV